MVAKTTATTQQQQQQQQQQEEEEEEREEQASSLDGRCGRISRGSRNQERAQTSIVDRMVAPCARDASLASRRVTHQ